MRHEIVADEAWTHGGQPLNRYWCFWGGVMGTEGDMGRLEQRLRATAEREGIAGEIKWTKLRPGNQRGYSAFADTLFDEIEQGRVRWRQMFCDRQLVRVPPFGEPAFTDLDVQYKLCYQFLKHAFGLAFLDPSSDHQILARLDTHSSQHHKTRLANFAREIPQVLERPGITLQVTYDQSDRSRRIQVCDLLLGAAGYHGNRHWLRRDPDSRSANANHAARKQLAKHVYDRLRAIDASKRRTRAFNWFESTGIDTVPANVLHHAVRIWKFRPSQYRIDKGWERDHLDPRGCYVAPELIPRVRSVEAWEPVFESATGFVARR